MPKVQSLMANSLVESTPTAEVGWVETRKTSRLHLEALALCVIHSLIVVLMVLSPSSPAKPYRLLS